MSILYIVSEEPSFPTAEEMAQNETALPVSAPGVHFTLSPLT